MPKAFKQARDVQAEITDKIVAMMESGLSEGKWRAPWHAEGGFGDLPRNVITGKSYQGLNVIVLWGQAHAKGYESNVWGTYKQWESKGANVRQGEKGTLAFYWNRVEKKDRTTGEYFHPPQYMLFASGFTLFNANQVDGWQAPPKPVTAPKVIGERHPVAEAYFAAIPAKVNHGGNKAFYSPGGDFIGLPDFDAFDSPESYYATRGHESVHWTMAKDRCDRNMSGRFGDQAYAAEELVAELGAAFLCAGLGITNEPREDHATYLASWLKVLKGDKTAIFTAASKANAAVKYLDSLAGAMDEGEAEDIAA
jgi:antirestriction protein ArdC